MAAHGRRSGTPTRAEYDEFAAPRRELEEMIANAEKRIADGNGFQRDGYLIREAREHAKRYGLEGYDDTLNDLAKRGQAAFDRRLADADARRAAAAQTDRERREVADAADAAKYAGPVKMTMDEWKRIHRDFKSFNGGNRTVMQDGRILPGPRSSRRRSRRPLMAAISDREILTPM